MRRIWRKAGADGVMSEAPAGLWDAVGAAVFWYHSSQRIAPEGVTIWIVPGMPQGMLSMRRVIG